MPDIEQWLKEQTGTDFFKFTTPQDEVSPESLFWRAVTNEFGVVVIPKDRNLQLRDLLPVVIVDTNRHAIRRMISPESFSNRRPGEGIELESMPARFPLERKSGENERPRKIERPGTVEGHKSPLPPLEIDRNPLGKELDDLFRFNRRK